jgi:hypothetical protein
MFYTWPVQYCFKLFLYVDDWPETELKNQVYSKMFCTAIKKKMLDFFLSF